MQDKGKTKNEKKKKRVANHVARTSQMVKRNGGKTSADNNEKQRCTSEGERETKGEEGRRNKTDTSRSPSGRSAIR